VIALTRALTIGKWAAILLTLALAAAWIASIWVEAGLSFGGGRSGGITGGYFIWHYDVRYPRPFGDPQFWIRETNTMHWKFDSDLLYHGEYVCYLPIWMIAAPAAVVSGLMWGIEPVLRRRRRLQGCCARCGYDRRGITSDAKCPECGADWKQICS